MFINEPLQYVGDENNAYLVMGGEGCQWTELSDSDDIQRIVWPRASAIAERLWGPQNINDAKSELPMLQYFQCLMNDRGISAGLVNNLKAGQPPTNPDSCYIWKDYVRLHSVNTNS